MNFNPQFDDFFFADTITSRTQSWVGRMVELLHNDKWKNIFIFLNDFRFSSFSIDRIFIFFNSNDHAPQFFFPQRNTILYAYRKTTLEWGKKDFFFCYHCKWINELTSKIGLYIQTHLRLNNTYGGYAK